MNDFYQIVSLILLIELILFADNQIKIVDF